MGGQEGRSQEVGDASGATWVAARCHLGGAGMGSSLWPEGETGSWALCSEVFSNNESISTSL